jgi:hypothetical protein
MKEPPVVIQQPSVEGAVPREVRSAEDASAARSIWDNRLFVLGMLFFVTAALGLPWLWKSRGFTSSQKKFWSVVVAVYTAFIFWLFYLVMAWSYHQVMDALQI